MYAGDGPSPREAYGPLARFNHGVRQIMHWTAPRSRPDAALKFCLMIAFIHAWSIWVEWMLMGFIALGPVVRFLVTSGTAAPFVALTLYAVGRAVVLKDRLGVVASTDMLTGVANRRGYFQEARRAVAEGGGLLLILDADHFKAINDRYGHQVGDACLVAIARHLAATLSTGDLLGRIGGEEFCIFLPGAGPERTDALSQRLCRPIPVSPGVPGVPDLTVTMSAGATRIGRVEPIETAIRRADIALYRAKGKGRARMEYVAPEGERGAVSPGASGGCG